jgi:hypothetical protein
MLSDMVHSTPREDFDQMTDGGLRQKLETLRRTYVIPELAGACVAVVGVNLDNAHAKNLRRFWMSYFQAAGATLQEANYRSVLYPQDLRCG